jgi:hypothetical protein
MLNSRQKGARGERELAHHIQQAGFNCRRDGRLESDLDWELGVHAEVKRTEKPALGAWCQQAEQDSIRFNKPSWVVFWRSNRRPWVAVIPLEEYLRLRKLEAASDLHRDT